MILEEISHQKHCGWALCAAVCKEWQVVIERENFCRLTIQASCLKELKNIVIRQRSLVRYICLDVKLPRYACRSCRQSSSMACISKYSSLVRDAIVKLFSILHGWQPTGHLILELSAFSPSDSEHWFKNYCFGPGHKDIEDWTQIGWHDPNHGWVDGQQVKAPRTPAILRLFSQLYFSLPEDLLYPTFTPSQGL